MLIVHIAHIRGKLRLIILHIRDNKVRHMADHSHHGSHGTMGSPSTVPSDVTSTSSGFIHEGSHGPPTMGPTMDHGMKMFFHFSLGDTCLFEGWKLNEADDMIIACMVFFLIAVAYEGLKSYREFLIKRDRLRRRAFPISVIGGGGDLAYRTSNGTTEPAIPNNGGGSPPIATVTRTPDSLMFSTPHAIQTLLHMVQVLISYVLMLVLMTFNAYLCISIVLGAGLGYFAFCWRRFTVIDETEHCH